MYLLRKEQKEKKGQTNHSENCFRHLWDKGKETQSSPGFPLQGPGGNRGQQILEVQQQNSVVWVYELRWRDMNSLARKCTGEKSIGRDQRPDFETEKFWCSF